MSDRSPTPQFSRFADFWLHYAQNHRHPVNQALHVAGTVGGLICLGLGVSLSWKWLLAMLPIGYGAAWLGHYLFERNRPLTLTHPVWSFRADWRMVLCLLSGKPLPTPAKVESAN